ncbi:SDR family NAD(P)-dependent oxidoreductase [Lichenicoccus sp.]|uniref:SDR family NAD(P)-dependent oxidoreductase n=1 Tax=Lichenicoccus sp. TaxID=2781899 RepID=UPI003D10C06E
MNERKVAIVTGGSRGVGAAIARALAEQSHDLVLAFNADGDAAEVTAKQLRAIGSDPLLMHVDIRSRASVETLFDAARERFGRIDVVCANAGVEKVDTPFAEISEADLDLIVDTNVKGTFFTLQQAARHVTDGGRIIATASTIALYPPANAGAYAPTKAAVRLMVEVLAQELGPRRVTVNTLDPGIVAGAGVVTHVSDDERAHFVEGIPLGRMLTPDDLKGMIAFLVSDGAAMVTGQHLCVTGGGRP